ncbi:MAG: hypothetical protein JWN30_2016 [Bacilli bacterium]|nr:hypothetical protein [Bacilli bacterium]
MTLRLEQFVGRVVEMIYQDRAGVISHRRVRIVSVQGNYVRAYCYARRAVRSFSEETILALFPMADDQVRHKMVK